MLPPLKATTLGLRSRMMLMLVTVFPDPDSPTMAKISPGDTLKDTPSTARTTPSTLAKYVHRLQTSKIASRVPTLETVDLFDINAHHFLIIVAWLCPNKISEQGMQVVNASRLLVGRRGRAELSRKPL